MTSDTDESPLVRALGRAGFGGMPVEIWVAIANGWSAEGPRLGVADAKKFARAHPEVVRSHETADGTRYDRQMGPEPKTVGESLARLARWGTATSSPEQEDAIALELVALVEYRSLAGKSERYGQFIGIALLDLGRLYGATGRRSEAKQTTKAAIAEFRATSLSDRRALADLSRAKAQLSRLRWRR